MSATMERRPDDWSALTHAPIDPDELNRAMDRFPEVEFRAVPWRDLRACKSCPPGPWDPPSSEALIAYRHCGREVHLPVDGGCLIDVLLDLDRDMRSTVLHVEILLHMSRAVA